MIARRDFLGAAIAAACMLPAERSMAGGGMCGLVETGDWAVEIVPAQDGGQPVLVVTGRVVAPTAGWTVELRAGPTARSMPPIQMIALEATAPDGIVAQVLTEHQLKLELPGEPAYRAVRIGCGEELVREFTDVKLAG
ncbi:MAG: hypothetical protein H6891_07120 [Brucellaceae bacterium]|nr:hypothetical protein [Brucellaceae bacterium]